ncbi:hypothetical protein OC845_005151 [Tilletia horrida]|nr:hypothetical protein OC845_005151 [Tilletia horrida]
MGVMRHDNLLAQGTTPTLSNLAIRGLKGDLLAPRYLLWKLWFSHLPLASTSSWQVILDHERSSYTTARRNALRAPDGSLPPGLDADPTTKSEGSSRIEQKRPSSLVANLQVNNPLSLESSNPWPEHFAALDMLQTIKADVERAFPDFEATEENADGTDTEAHSAFFKQERVAQGLTHILFVWAKANEDIGYRQGMHEIAGAIWLARERSFSTDSASSLDEGKEVLLDFSSSRYIEHDTYSIFEELMRAHRHCFEWRPPVAAPPVSGAQTSGQDIPKPTVSAMIARCEKVQDLIRVIDPSLGATLDELDIEPQLWVMRWIRMLFLREYDLPTTLLLWDGIFLADAGTLDLVNYIAIAMLLRIRGKLFEADNSTALQLLLRFPTSEVVPAENPEALKLLLSQAARLQQSATPSTGVSILMQNRDELNIEIEQPPTTPVVPDPPRLRTALLNSSPGSTRPSEARTVAGGRAERRRTALPDRSTGPLSPASSSTSFASFLPSGVSEAAKGLYERSETLGINRALANTVTNVQRTVNAYAQQGVRSGAAVGSDGFPRGFESIMSTNRANSTATPASTDAPPQSSQPPRQRAFQRFESPSKSSQVADPLSEPQQVPSYATYTRSKGRSAISTRVGNATGGSTQLAGSVPGGPHSSASPRISNNAPSGRPQEGFPPAIAQPASAPAADDPLGAL